MSNFLEMIGGRKFALALIVFLVTGAYAWFEFLVIDDFRDMVRMLLVIYPAGAIGQAYLTNKAEEAIPDSNMTLVRKEDQRKFILVLVVFAVTSTLFGFSKISSPIYVEICQWLVGTYITGNVITKFVDNGFSIALNKTS